MPSDAKIMDEEYQLTDQTGVFDSSFRYKPLMLYCSRIRKDSCLFSSGLRLSSSSFLGDSITKINRLSDDLMRYECGGTGLSAQTGTLSNAIQNKTPNRNLCFIRISPP